jgi:hypothetical protein
MPREAAVIASDGFESGWRGQARANTGGGA